VRPGRIAFSWDRRSRAGAECELVVARSADFASPTISEAPRRAVHLLEAGRLGPGRWFWKVVARNPNGAAESVARELLVDPAAELPAGPDAAEAPDPTPEGLIVAAALRGGPEPSHGLLMDSAGVARAEGPRGPAVSFDGEKGRIRYAVPWFPERDCTVSVRFCPTAFPEGRIGQVFSAWAAGMDDPLRIVVDGGKLFARIEAQGVFGTEGIPLERGKWIHVAAVKAGPKLTLWVDGEERASARVPEEVASQATNVALGGNPNFSGNEFLSARMADFVLHARALSPEEVRALAR
jgi:hypothetical protein